MMKRKTRIQLAAVGIALMAASPTLADSMVPLAARLGITPESLVIANVTTTQAEMILDNLAAETTLQASLAQAIVNADAAAADVTMHSEALVGGVVDAQALQDLQTAESDLSTAISDIQFYEAALFDEAMTNVPSGAISIITIVKSGAGQKVPHEFRATQRTDQQWRLIKRALRAEARAQRLSQTLDTDHATLLANVRAESAVTVAASELSQDLAVMKALFETQID